jgi:hypothetical protein
MKNKLLFLKKITSLVIKHIEKCLTKLKTWVSMFRLSKWLCHWNVYVLSFAMQRHYFSSGHWHKHFLQPGQAERVYMQPT